MRKTIPAIVLCALAGAASAAGVSQLLAGAGASVGAGAGESVGAGS